MHPLNETVKVVWAATLSSLAASGVSCWLLVQQGGYSKMKSDYQIFKRVTVTSVNPPVQHICISDLGQHWFRLWLVACSAPSHDLNQCWLIVNWTLRNKLQWNLNRNSIIFIQEIAFECVVCEMAAILSRPQCVKERASWYIWYRSSPSSSQRGDTTCGHTGTSIFITRIYLAPDLVTTTLVSEALISLVWYYNIVWIRLPYSLVQCNSISLHVLW